MKSLLVIYHPQLLISDKVMMELTQKAEKMGFKPQTALLDKNIIEQALLSLHEELSAVVIAGGDGSLNCVINILLNLNITSIPLAVVPWGTTNDFADQIYKSTFRLEKLLRAIKRENTVPVDIGQVNNRFFINVAGAGLFVDVAHKTSDTLKQRLGRMAYYLEGARSFFPMLKPFTVQVENSTYRDELELLLFLVLNTKRAGGLRKLAPHASLNDGKLDLLLIRYTNLAGILTLVPRMIRGLHLDDSRVTYFQTEDLSIYGPVELATDLDGEPGPPFPLHFKVLPQKMRFFTF